MIYPPTASESPLATFPSYPPWQTLRELTDQLLDSDGAVSLYLSLAPSEAGVIRDRLEQEHALIDELRKDAAAAEAGAASHESEMALRALPDRVDEFLAGYRPSGRHIHGVAIFATLGGYRRPDPACRSSRRTLARSPTLRPPLWRRVRSRWHTQHRRASSEPTT
jgi:hypothetical protein